MNREEHDQKEEDRKFWSRILSERLKELYSRAREGDLRVNLTLQSIKEKGLN